MIQVGKPFIPKESITYVNDALESGWVSSLGKYIDKCTDFLKEKFGYKYVLLTSNGTCSNHLMVKCLQYRYVNKTIFCPNNIYVAAWNPFLQEGYHKLIFVDADIDTWNIDYKNVVQKYYRDTIFYIVNNLGNVINIDELKKNIKSSIIIEDNCEGFLGKNNGKWSGSESLMSTISFYANKTIQCGEGGAFITQDRDLYEYAKCIFGQGQSDRKFIHKFLGYNYRMTNMQAALLLGQFENLDYIMKKKKEIYNYYKEQLKNIEEVLFQKVEDGTEHSNWMFCIRILNSLYFKAEKFFSNGGIETRPMFYPVTHHPYLYNVFCKIHNAKILSDECVVFPSFLEITKEQQDFIISAIKLYIYKLKRGEI